MKGAMSMYDHKWKKWGAVISALGLAGMIGERVKGFIIVKKWTVLQHYGMFEWVMLLGLAVVMYSKEKFDDERAKMIRLKALQMSFLLVIGVLMSMGFVGTLDGKMELPAEVLYLMASFGLVFYLLFFHIGLYFDFLWDYEDRGVWENLRNIGKNKWGLIVYLLVSTIMLALLAMLQMPG